MVGGPEIAVETSGLVELLSAGGLPPAAEVVPLSGRGFETQVYLVRLADGRQVVWRSWGTAREPEHARARFLAAHGVPAPRLLASTGLGSLYEFVPGTLLGDLLDAGQWTPDTWRLVGSAYRRVHDIRFPAGLWGEVLPERVVLEPVDPVARLHQWIEEAMPGLERRFPGAVAHLPALHRLVDRAAEPLRKAGSALLHGDVNMWNIMVGPEGVRLIDWDHPQVGDPALEIALLDKHASVIHPGGLHPAFFEGYGRPAPEPNATLYRVVRTVHWVATTDWEAFARRFAPEMREVIWHRHKAWLDYVQQLPMHVQRLQGLA